MRYSLAVHSWATIRITCEVNEATGVTPGTQGSGMTFSREMYG